MTAFATALTLAALVCEPDVAPFFVLPRPAVTNRVLRTNAIPQRVNATNYVGRLDGDVMSALYGTTEALFERRLFPLVMNYGGARTAKAKDLATANFGPGITNTLHTKSWFWVYSPYDDEPLPAFFCDPENRNFTNRYTRVAWPVDLLDGVVYGDRAIRHGTNALFHVQIWDEEKDAPCNPFYLSFRSALDASRYALNTWLVPRAFAPQTEGPDGSWHLNNTTATADWAKGHLLALGEIPLWQEASETALDEYRFRPKWESRPPLTSLLPTWAHVFMSDYQGFVKPDEDCYWSCIPLDWAEDRCKRGKALGITARDLYWDYPTNEAPHVVATNKTSRFYAERFAFANTSLSLCERSLDYPTVQSWTDATNVQTYLYSGVPLYRFNARKFHGAHKMQIPVEAPEGAIKLTFDAGDSSMVCEVDRDKLVMGEATSTNACTNVTYITESPCAGWTETGRGITFGLAALLHGVQFNKLSDWAELTPANPDADFSTYKWSVYGNFGMQAADGKLLYLLYLKATATHNVPPFAYGGMTALIGDVAFDPSKPLGSYGYFHYAASYNGVTPLGSIRRLVGPTSIDSPSVTNEAEWSIAPMSRAKFLWDAGIIESVDVTRFTTIGVSTNADVVASVSKGDAFDPGGRSIEDQAKDTWAYFRCENAFSAKSQDMLRGGFESFHQTMLEDIKAIAAENASGNDRQPTRDEAESLPSDDVKTACAAMLDGKAHYQIDPYSTDGLSYIGEALVVQDATDKTKWDFFIAPEQCVLRFPFGMTTNLESRSSAAYSYTANPLKVTNWKFPMMREESQDK